jgi:hypothetical protein
VCARYQRCGLAVNTFCFVFKFSRISISPHKASSRLFTVLSGKCWDIIVKQATIASSPFQFTSILLSNNITTYAAEKFSTDATKYRLARRRCVRISNCATHIAIDVFDTNKQPAACTTAGLQQPDKVTALMKMAVCWDVESCSLANVYRRFRGASCPHYRSDNGGSMHSETSVIFYPTTSRNMPEDVVTLSAGKTHNLLYT